MNKESLEKAIHDAGFLVQDLRELHTSLCSDNPTHEAHIAERHVLELLQAAVELRDRVKGLVP